MTLLRFQGGRGTSIWISFHQGRLECDCLDITEQWLNIKQRRKLDCFSEAVTFQHPDLVREKTPRLTISVMLREKTETQESTAAVRYQPHKQWTIKYIKMYNQSVHLNSMHALFAAGSTNSFSIQPHEAAHGQPRPAINRS